MSVLSISRAVDLGNVGSILYSMEGATRKQVWLVRPPRSLEVFQAPSRSGNHSLS